MRRNYAIAQILVTCGEISADNSLVTSPAITHFEFILILYPGYSPANFPMCMQAFA